MKTALKISGLFLGFIFFLAITINEKPIFSYIYDVISPVTKSAQNATAVFFGRSVSSTQDYSKKLFENSIPKINASVKKNIGEPAEKITEKEKAELDQLIKTHR